MIFDWFRRKSAAEVHTASSRRPPPEAPPHFRDATDAMLRQLAAFGIAPAAGVSNAVVADNLFENGDGLDGEWVWWDLFHSLSEASWIHGGAGPVGFSMLDFKSIEGSGSYVSFVTTVAELAGSDLPVSDPADHVDPLGGGSLARWRIGGETTEIRLDGQKWVDGRLFDALQADLAKGSSRRIAIWGDGNQHAILCMEPDQIAEISRLTRLDFEVPAAADPTGRA